MSLKNKLLRQFPFLTKLNGFKNLKKTLTSIKRIKQVLIYKKMDFDTISLTKENFDIFKKSFLKFVWSQPEDADLPLLFFETKIKPISNKIDIKSLSEFDPLLICVVKNDIDRVKMILKHYRNIGIKGFVFVDNMSTDGTSEYLTKQNDVDLFICETSYTTKNREAWINRVIGHYGFDRWYLCVDSDELFIYENYDKIIISEFIKTLKKRRVLSFLLDMYSKEYLFMNDVKSDEIIKKYCYFDTGTYCHRSNYKMEIISGGPRQRVFFENNNNTFMLTKYPLFYFEKGDIQCCSHYQFPYKENFGFECKTALLHYKFLKSDLDKYLERAKIGNYANGSFEYKKYAELYSNGQKISLYNSESAKFENYESLNKIKWK
ncbi:MAG: glycosyltransferase family 2 protein [Erysipelotrichales bacterium]|nr:glycosyltransferase family 2 protein [Erysipelotrichales bacterium]